MHIFQSRSIIMRWCDDSDAFQSYPASGIPLCFIQEPYIGPDRSHSSLILLLYELASEVNQRCIYHNINCSDSYGR